ncbi:hypothetical protein OJF2_54160 [Aquisphaera giovannonii]|uniref:Uncharacterized protein n=1 Tax=Aquisphaera giovannonii TaxID=406548 RepID=A0A5B9W9S3_9BACT|nr:hypothetical protein [Aquisphaera giovannonii]QEH36831.1 hypothetical protein OJF2_54160 [Aquisphaera giovannonii]
MTTELEAKLAELEALKAQVEKLENDIQAAQLGPSWRATGYYGAYYATAGFVLGGVAALVSLLVNVLAAPLAGKSPLELVRVYLTFPLGEKALQLTQGQNAYAVNDRVILAFGCCLYVATGMLVGIPIAMALGRFAAKGGVARRLVVASIVSLAVWAIMFYGILSWLQPLLVEGDPGNWITNPAYLPWWVAAATHLVFGWTVALLYPLAEYHPYRRLLEPAPQP